MGYQRLAYDEADTAATMRRDCDRAVLRLARPATPPAATVDLGARNKVKRAITVDEAAQRLAAALHLR